MSEQSSKKIGGLTGGTWAVIVVVVVGFVLATVAYRYWRMQAEHLRGQNAPGESAGAASWDEAAARDELEKLGESFTNAVGVKQDLAPFLDAARRLVAKYPEFAAARTLDAQVLLMNGKAAEALAQLEESLRLNPPQANLHEMAGQIALELHRVDEAAGHFSQAVSLEPGQVRYRLELARVYVVRDDFDKARDTVLQALTIDSGSHEAYFVLSDLYAQRNMQDMALDQIQKAIDRTPLSQRDKQALYIRRKALLLRRVNKPDEALLTLETLTSKEQSQPDVLAEIAACWAMQGEPGRAADVYERAFRDDPQQFQLLAQIAHWRIKAGDMDAARRAVEMLRRFAPNAAALPELESQLR